ncbi:hypothetical protein SODALDRAFT_334971 [Sodiomyces alkalinus F11]|uniref:Uncharacterized protein n=1 Tax=Sodiomyces alkalinus (strain CBS 110278 / VKM F-3762 / F11) TaxID=1314773 RepID=A0A3N2PQP0_SODAK|nr:hypothetical protein SODALDRAFT_334971 [Sodiomyces alkalinus F11]ROT36774.1 hypothetical protein SODALDRAFT_334971 [Sodiomyces alkalinus F11]
MDSEPEIIQKTKAALEPYIKPREEVAYIRRVLAIHLQRHRQTEDLQPPLSLLDASSQAQRRDDIQGLQREYLRAAHDNIRARREYAELRKRTTPQRSTSTSPKDNAPDYIQNHLAMMKLRQKHEKLSTLQKYLDTLVQQPAASQEFLSPDHLFLDAWGLPDVPREVMEGFGISTSALKEDLSGLIDQLEKVVLRSKLQLRREQQLLSDVRAGTQPLMANISVGAKLHALNVTRNELINWIEAELSKASGETAEEEEAERETRRQRLAEPQTDTTAQLAEIKEKYARYVAARKSLLTLVSQKPLPTLKPTITQQQQQQPAHTLAAAEEDDTPAPATHLMIPYLERLLHLSRQQKGMIQHKSHLQASLAKQVKDTRQMLDHLAEESQLLPTHGSTVPRAIAAVRSKPGFGDHIAAASAASGAAEKPDTTGFVKPWVIAADTAKIATLEAAAEKIEEGQLALEGSMKALHDIDQLLGRKREGNNAEVGDGQGQTADGGEEGEDDIWLTGEQDGKRGRKKHMERKRAAPAVLDDPWSILDGKLGLISGKSLAR